MCDTTASSLNWKWNAVDYILTEIPAMPLVCVFVLLASRMQEQGEQWNICFNIFIEWKAYEL